MNIFKRLLSKKQVPVQKAQERRHNGRNSRHLPKQAAFLASLNNGVLPNSRTLIDNGFNGLYQYMWKHPEEFSKYDQVKKLTLISEHVSIAERLAANNNGKIPTNKWLHEHGQSKLVDAMRKYQSHFDHLTQQDSLKDLVQIAKKLAEENGGSLPSLKILRETGHTKLANRIQDRPDAFKDVPRRRRHHGPVPISN
jgi:hypothetical protein